ncbi:prepilin-type N-terminal cleavage/methylation domain-containing protein, partial [Clostridium perfringens]
MSLRKQNKKKKGFTLIELIIVIAIIAILAAIAIPNFLSIQRKARV